MAADMELFGIICQLCWYCYTMTPSTSLAPIFPRILTDRESADRLLSSLDLQFGPDLLAILRSNSPPSIDWLKTLRNDRGKVWAVYLLVLEKEGCRYRIYVGSGTNSTLGAPNRMSTYRNVETCNGPVPYGVRDAVAEGYKITHAGYLC